ncbi:T9SS C-terminal target domain-containing protein [Aquimarina sp. BL5]|uniref:Ig-like domain-containing protein n=1 Tax=Aquimarina sp. BL5 TaxID=1714860 RepID=UPI000E47096D|nr:Ig-like domain-containing protein [Aquimarina sp. BL5]AXT53519.1 T9SS C-terminal target domain-containing protein [Aquimarina sp. BL5]RKM92777.1 T9SS C-terminal target domain-containing protein [Aquimarina sp. BL5]
MLQYHLPKKKYLRFIFLIIPILVQAQLDQTYFQRLKTERVPSENDIEWKQFGPGNAGFSDFLRYHPTQPDVIVMGPDLFVVWQSENNGQSWFNIKDKDGNGEFSRLRDLYYSGTNESFGLAIESSQLWKTIDMGRNWTIVQNAPWYNADTDGSDGLGFISKVSSIAIDPNDDNTWYVGTGGHIRGESRFTTQSNVNAANPRGRENISFQGVAFQGSIYKTMNGGTSWTELTNGIDSKAQFCRIIVNPSNNQEVYAASIDGLYKSENGGTTWTNIGEGKLPNNTIVDMDFYYDVTSDRFVLYLIDQIRYFPSGNTTTNTGGIFKTEDNGVTFTDITGDLYIDVNQLTGGVPQNYDQYIANWFGISVAAAQSTYPVRPTNVLQYFNSLNVDPSRPDALYVGFADAQIQNSIVPGRLWGTSNGGQKWTNLARDFGPAWENDRTYWESRGNPFNDNMVMGHEPFIQQFGQNYPLRSLRYCSVNSRGDVMIIAGHNTLLSTDNGVTFNQVDEDNTATGLVGRGNSNLPGESIHQDKRLGPDRPLMGSGEHRLWLLTDDGTNDRQGVRQIKNSRETISTLVTHPLNKDIIFTTSYRQAGKERIERSTDGGESFSDWGLATPAESQMRTQSLGVDPKNPDIMFFGITDKEINDVDKEGGFYYSDDGGRTFTPRNTGLPTNVRISDIKIDPRDQTNASYFAAAQRLSFSQGSGSSPLAQGGLYFTNNRGLNWTRIDIAPGVTGVNRIEFDTTNRMYVTSGHRGTFNENITGGVWYTDDFGVTWTRIFDNDRTFSIDVSPFDNNILVATIGFLQLNPGIYLSEDRGLTWKKNNIDGLNTEIRNVEFDLHDATTLWAVSLGNGFNRGAYSNGTQARVLSVSPFEVDMQSGETETIQATILRGGFNQSDITWSSSNPSIATVDQNGNVTAVSMGQAKITALIASRYSDFAIITVDAPEPPAPLLADGEYFIESPVNQQRLVALSSENFNARMDNGTSNDLDTWTLIHLGNDVYTFQNKATSRYLEVTNGSCGNQTNVTTGIDNTETYQMFKIEENGENYSIKPQHCLVQGVDRDFGAVDANIHTFFFNPTNVNQQWNITPTDPLNIASFKFESVRFAPNPANEQITFTGVTGNIRIKISDLSGKLLMTKTLNPGTTIVDISELSRGLYIISSQDNSWSKKLIK